MSTPRDEIWVDMVQFDTRVADALWDGEPPDDAPAWYTEVAARIRSARSCAHPSELSDGPHLVATMQRAAQGDTRARVQRSSTPRTVGRVVAMKASAVATVGVLGITAAAAAIGTVASVVVPAIEKQFVTSGPDEHQDEQGPITVQGSDQSGVGTPHPGPGHCDVRAGHCTDRDTAPDRATSSERRTAPDDARRSPAAREAGAGGTTVPSTAPAGPPVTTGAPAHSQSAPSDTLPAQDTPPATVTAPTESSTAPREAPTATPVTPATPDTAEPATPTTTPPPARAQTATPPGAASEAGAPAAGDGRETPAAPQSTADQPPDTAEPATPTTTPPPARARNARPAGPPAEQYPVPEPERPGAAGGAGWVR